MMLTKSIIRYVIKHAETDGEIKRGNTGFGYTGPSLFKVPSQDRKHAFQGFCSHPHTWPLFCYFKLKA